MHLYYFNLPNKSVLRLVSEKPLEIDENRFIHTTFGGKPLTIPTEVCFYFDGAMCLTTAPKEISSIVDKATDRLDDVVLFFSGFQKFVAPFLSFLSAQEKANFRDALYSLNQVSEFVELPEYCNFLMIYLEYTSKINVVGLDFNPKQFFTAIRKGNI